MMRPIFKSSVLGVLVACLAFGVSAQETSTTSGDSNNSERKPQSQIEELTVTATKREASIQDIPIAITAFSGADLSERGVGDLENLQNIAPSLSVYSTNSTSNGATVRVRGIGTTGNNPGLEAAVGMFIDGVYRSRSGQAYNDLLDIERIEILRGPQGTLFGKNTSAGAVHIITKKPEYQLGYKLEADYGNLDFRSVKGSVTGPLIGEWAAFRVNAAYSERDGFYEEFQTGGEKFSDIDRRSVKGQFMFDFTPDVTFNLTYDWRQNKETCCPATYKLLGPTAPAIVGVGGTTPTTPNSHTTKVSLNSNPYEHVWDWGLTGTLDWELGWGKMTSITAWRDWKVHRGQDIDFSSADILDDGSAHENFENFSQEIRFTGTAGAVDWLAGVYGYSERLKNDLDLTLGSDADAYLTLITTAPGLAATGEQNYQRFNQESIGWSFFTHNIWHATDRLDATLGLRWNWEHKDGKGVVNGAAPGAFVNNIASCGGAILPVVPALAGLYNSFCDNRSFKDDETEREYTATFNLSYALTDDMNVYGGYSRGYKAGGFNLDRQADQLDITTGRPAGAVKFDPEFTDAYELGLKGTFLDRRLTLNAALFYMQIEGFQLNTFTGLGFIISNLKEVVSRGLETEANLLVAPGVFLSTGLTINDARYSNNELDCEFPIAALRTTPDCLRGKRLTHAPAYQGNAALSVERELLDTGWTAMFNTSVTYRGKVNTASDLDPVKNVSGFWNTNASLGLRPPGSNLVVMLWAQNLFDERHPTVIFDSVLQNGSYSTYVNSPRLFGIRFTYDY